MVEENSRKPAYTYPVPRQERERLAPAGLRVYKGLADLLGLSQYERMAILGLPEEAELSDLKELTEEQFYRLSYLFGIWIDTGTLFGQKEAIQHLKAPRSNEKMAGQNAIAYLIDGGLPAFDELRREAAYWANNGW